MSSDAAVPASTWWYIAILVLGIVILALFARPCEVYRLEVFIKHSEFGWNNTVCAPMEARGCHCVTVNSNNPWTIGDWTTEPKRISDPDQEVMPRVEF